MFVKVYHISLVKHRESILTNGLKPIGANDPECRWSELNYTPRICVSFKYDDPSSYDFVDYEGVDVYQFTVLKKHLKKDKHSENKMHYYIEHHITPKQLRLIKSVGFYKRNFI